MKIKGAVSSGLQLAGMAAVVGAIGLLAGGPWALLVGGVVAVVCGALIEAGKI